jgi:outer membrane protein assembly factor BamB
MKPQQLTPYVLIVLAVAGIVAALWLSGGRNQQLPPNTPPPPIRGVPAPDLADLPTPPPAHQWTMHRGRPELAGLADGALTSLPELRWTVELSGAVHGGPAIAGQTVYVATAAGRLHAISLADGAERWSVALESPVESVPLVTDDRVYLGTESGQLVAIDLAERAIRWTYRTEGKILGSANLVHLPADPNWTGEQGETVPLASRARTLIIIGSYDGRCHAVHAATGRSAWTYATDNFVHGTPAVAAGAVVLAGCDASLHVLSARTGEAALTADARAYVAGSPAVAGGVAYVGNYEGTFLAIDLDDGSEVWSFTNETGLPFYASPAVTGGLVLAACRDKTLYALDRATGEVRWTFSARRKIDSAPVVAGRRVVFGSDDGRVYVVSLDSGERVWSYQVGPPIVAAPAVADGRIVIADEDGNVYCFGRPE